MIKGCNKRVIWIRNTENELFEQAYFILSDSACVSEKTDNDIIKEAKQLINNSPVGAYWDHQPSARWYIQSKWASSVAKNRIIFFSFGFVLGAIPALILMLV